MRNTIIKASLIAAGFLLSPPAAYSAGLGKLTVNSALGQPLRAEVDLLTDPGEDVSSLSAQLASLEAFKQANIARAPVLRTLKFTIAKRADGQPYLEISSAEPINDPFLDMLVELDWASGRLVREYTVLLDPPGFRETQAHPAAPATAPAAPAPLAEVPKPAETARKASPPTGPATYGPVKRGDTLSKIARGVKVEGIDLDQVLVGLFRSNPDAFAGHNMNRLKVGRIIHIPEATQLAAVDRAEAIKAVRAQAADWHAYRQRLAAAVAAGQAQQEAAPKQAVSGKISGAVEDKAMAGKPAAEDVLKLSKGAGPGAGGGVGMKTLQDRVNALQEDAIAREKTIQEANARIAELEKNIREMQKLLALKSQTMADLQKRAGTAKEPPAEPTAPAPVTAAAPTQPPAAVAKPAAPKPVAPKPAAKPKPPAPTPEAAPWYRSFLDNPLYLAAVGALVVLAGALALLVLGNRRKKGLNTFEDSIMTGGDLKANTVLGETAGGVIDTGDTSFLTDFSQAGLGTIDTNDVDPIAEAEVYMAYGRDAQAEEILKEALAKDPNRHEIHLKLLEIYAARKNLVAFETLASELYAAIGGKSDPIWEKAAGLGRELDPNNPLYGQAKGGVAPQSGPGVAAAAAGMAAAAVAADESAVAEPEGMEDASPDLEFNLDDDLGASEIPPTAGEEGPSPAGEVPEFDLDLEANREETAEPAPEAEAERAAPEAEAPGEEDMGLDFDLDTIIPQAIEKNQADGTETPAAAEIEEAAAGETEEAGAEEAEAAAPDEAPAPAAEAEPSLDFDFNPETETEEATAGPEEAIVLEAPPEAPSLDFDFNLEEAPEPPEPEAEESQPEPSEPEPEAEPPASGEDESPAPDLDLSDISLDLDESPTVATEEEKTVEPESEQWQEVATKLDLAKAYLEMGDKEGAREILQEVVQEGDSSQQDDARALLGELG